MKIAKNIDTKYEEEINILEEGQEVMLGDIASKYFIIRRYLEDEEMPKSEENYIKKFSDDYGITVGIEEMVQWRDFFDNDYVDYVNDQIAEDKKHGSETVDLSRYGF